ncbi:MAG: GAF domain-containing protein [bacterium]
MNRAFQTGGSLLIVSFLFAVGYGFESVWIGRALTALVVSGAGFILNLPLAVTLGIFAIPSDLILISRSPDSLDMLVWAGYVGLPFMIDQYVRSGTISVSSPSQSTSQQPEEPGDNDVKTVDFHPEVVENRNASEQLQELLVSWMESARDQYGFDNLVYFHVSDDEAQPGYVINDYGDIKTDFSIDSSRARGVGWVLRHEEELTQEDQQIDWRNLQYHRKPVDPDKVTMVPFKDRQTPIGILVLEWESLDEDPGAFDSFVEDLEVLMSVDRSVRELERREKKVDLMQKVGELQPLEHDRLETLHQRITDMVRNLIPADHVAFIPADGNSTDETVVKQRRLFYEKCCEWMETGKQTLRINRIDNFSFKGQRIQKLTPPDVESFLGGILADEEGTLGYICLDDDQPEFFSSDDEKLLKLLVDRMSGLVRLARRHKSVQREREKLFEWIGEIRDASRITEPEESIDLIIKTLMETFSPVGAAVYWTVNDEFRLQDVSEGISPSPRLSSNSPVVRRLRDHSEQDLVEFPRIQRLTSYDPPKGASVLKVNPVTVDGNLAGFITLFFKEDPSPRINQFLEYGLPVLSRNLAHAHRYATLEVERRRDEVTNFPEYDYWKRSLNEKLADDPDIDLVVWRLVVPDFEDVVENRGLKRAEQWAKSTANRIRKDFSEDSTTRFHGTDFGGFSAVSSGQIDTVLDGLRRDLAEWSFPTGRWSQPPQTGYEVFHSPFPDVETMIEAARRDLLGRDPEKNQGKETALDSV